MPVGGDNPKGLASARDEVGSLERGFLEAALDSIVVIDAMGCVVEFNASAVETFGYSRDEALGRTLVELIIPPSLQVQHKQAFERFVQTREQRLFGQRLELTGMRSDGSEFPVELALSQVEGEPLLVCGAIRDISEETQLKEDLQRLADEQAALRHVATLVAKGTGPSEVFSAVAQGVAHVLGVPGINMIRFDQESTATKIAGWGTSPLDVGSHWNLDDPSVMALIAREDRPARIDSYEETGGEFSKIALAAGIRSGIGAPILVDGAAWGAIIAYSAGPERFPDDAESRLLRFTELMATAISNVQARDRLHDLVEEQRALRRVATLVASETEPQSVFDQACTEARQLLGADRAVVLKCTLDGDLEILGTSGGDEDRTVAQQRISIAARPLVAVLQNTSSAGRGAGHGRGEPACEVGAPVVVDGQLWGALIVEADHMLPSDSESTATRFAEMIATSVANAAARSKLLASRARIVTAGDEARRRIQRDLHDGAQQRIVASVIDLQLADERFESDPEAARKRVRSALQSLEAGLDELRELAAGLHPRILTRGGLHSALDALAVRCQLPVTIAVPASRYPSQLEAAAYFVVTEALANVTKHAHATRAQVKVEESDGELLISIEDDGVGGADPDNGTGLRGLEDRAEALGGQLRVQSVVGNGTKLTASIPLAYASSPWPGPESL
jgi:PAS domain S-box-containing protein